MSSLQDLKSDIKGNNIKQFYIFTGDELAVMDIYIEQIAKSLNAKIKRFDELADIYALAQKKSLISSSSDTTDDRFVLLCRDCKEFMTEDKLWDRIDSNEFQNKHTLIMVYSSIDKRSKMYKRFEKSIVVFEPLKTEILERYIEKDLGIKGNSARTLIDLCDNNYGRIILEEDKIKTYAEAENVSVGSSLEYLISSKAIYREPKDSIFDFVSAVCKGEWKSAFTLYQDCKDIEESILAILTVLYNNLKQMLQVKTYHGEDIVNGTGLTPFQIKCAKEKLGYFSTGDLVYNLRLIRSVEKSIKTGEIEQDIAIDYIMTQIGMYNYYV